MKKAIIAAVVCPLIVLVGCEKEEVGDELVEIAVTQKKQGEDISLLSTRIDGVSMRLQEIQQGLERIPRPSGTSESAATTEEESEGPQEVEFKDAPEYKHIMAELTILQQEVNLTRSGLIESQDTLEAEREREELQDPRQAMEALTNPQELDKRLGLLAANFGQTIQDVTRRQQFEVDIQRLRQTLAAPVNRQEQYNRALNDLTQRLNSEEADSRAREFIERQIRELQEASGEELTGRLERYQRMQTFRQIRDLTSTYDIPRETLTDSGIPAMGRGFGPGGERGGRREGDRRQP